MGSKIYQDETEEAKICTYRCGVETGGLAAACENMVLRFFNNWATGSLCDVAVKFIGKPGVVTVVQRRGKPG